MGHLDARIANENDDDRRDLLYGQRRQLITEFYELKRRISSIVFSS